MRSAAHLYIALRWNSRRRRFLMTAREDTAMHDPTVPDSPHLEGAQPTWGDLPYACELVHELWDGDGTPTEIVERLRATSEANKTNQLLTLLNKLDVRNEDGSLSHTGLFLATHYDSPSQQGLDGGPGLGAKQALSETEQGVFQTMLFERNWLPMVATVNLLATGDIDVTETKERATGFQQRVEHLDGYQNVNSVNSWKKKVQAHLDWAEFLDIAYESTQNRLALTGFGQQLHEQSEDDYHPDWP